MANGNGKPHGNTRYNWHEIEAYYVASNLSYDQLCEKFGCSMSSLATIAAENKWPDKRAKFRSEVGTEMLRESKAVSLFDKLQFDSMTERTTDLAVAVVAEKFTDEYKRFKAGQRSEIEALEMKEMMAVVKHAQDIKYRALNVPAPRQSVEITRRESFGDQFDDFVGTMRDELAGFAREFDETEACAALAEIGSGGNSKQPEADDCGEE